MLWMDLATYTNPLITEETSESEPEPEPEPEPYDVQLGQCLFYLFAHQVSHLKTNNATEPIMGLFMAESHVSVILFSAQ